MNFQDGGDGELSDADKTKEIKKQAAYLMLSVSRSIENNDYITARKTLIFIADSCQCAPVPDEETKYLIEICCIHLANVHKVLQKLKGEVSTKQDVKEKNKGMHGVFVMKYKKFLGQFECQDQHKKFISQKVLMYLSKINAILFNFQNTENSHSMIAMLKTYGHAFFIVLILIITLFLTLFQNAISNMFGIIFSSSSLGDVAIYLMAFFIVIPMLLIFIKEPLRKDKNFFEHKLGQQINKINRQCSEKRENIRFYIPDAQEFNVVVEVKKSQDEDYDWRSDLRS